MNILFLTTHLNSGGITSYLYLLTKGMVNKGHSVFVISGGGERTQEFKDLGAEVVSINIKTRSELNPKIYTALLFLSKYVERNNIHVIHAQTRVTQVMGQWLKWY